MPQLKSLFTFTLICTYHNFITSIYTQLTQMFSMHIKESTILYLVGIDIKKSLKNTWLQMITHNNRTNRCNDRPSIFIQFTRRSMETSCIQLRPLCNMARVVPWHCEALESHPKVVLYIHKIEICMVIDCKCSVKTYASGFSTICYFIPILFMRVIQYSKS